MSDETDTTMTRILKVSLLKLKSLAAFRGQGQPEAMDVALDEALVKRSIPMPAIEPDTVDTSET